MRLSRRGRGPYKDRTYGTVIRCDADHVRFDAADTAVAVVSAVAAVIAVGGCAALEHVETAPTSEVLAPTSEAPAPKSGMPAVVEASLNARVLELIATYPDGGFGGYSWPARRGTSGTTRDLSVGDDVIAH